MVEERVRLVGAEDAEGGRRWSASCLVKGPLRGTRIRSRRDVRSEGKVPAGAGIKGFRNLLIQIFLVFDTLDHVVLRSHIPLAVVGGIIFVTVTPTITAKFEFNMLPFVEVLLSVLSVFKEGEMGTPELSPSFERIR